MFSKHFYTLMVLLKFKISFEMIVFVKDYICDSYFCAWWDILHAFLLSADFFQNQLFQNSFRNTNRVSNSLDPDQARQNVGPGLGLNCLQRLSADDKRCK